MEPIVRRAVGGREGLTAFFAAIAPPSALCRDVEGVSNDIALPECPLREQSGLGQHRDELLLRFIHVLMTEMAHEIQVESRVARLLGEVNNTSLEKHRNWLEVSAWERKRKAEKMA